MWAWCDTCCQRVDNVWHTFGCIYDFQKHKIAAFYSGDWTNMHLPHIATVWHLCLFCFCQFAMVEVMVTSLMDEFYQTLIAFFRRKELFVLAICGFAFLLGIPCVMQVLFVTYRMNFRPVSTEMKKKKKKKAIHFMYLLFSVQVGIYVFQLMDHYTAIVSIMFLAFFEVIAICWSYGETTPVQLCVFSDVNVVDSWKKSQM